MFEHNKLVMTAFALDALQKEFEAEVYPNAKFFFPDNADLRQVKFIVWLMNRYKASDAFNNEVEQYYALELLKKG